MQDMRATAGPSGRDAAFFADGLGAEPMTVPDRRRRRLRRFLAGSGAAIAVKGLTVATSVVTIPLTIGYLGVERFGLWATLTALTSMLLFADLGLGNGLLNLVSEAEGRDDPAFAKRAISTTAVLLLAVAGIIAAVTFILLPIVPWGQALNVTDAQAQGELPPAIGAFFVLFAIGLPLSVIDRTRLGLQEAYATYGWGAIGAIGSLVGILIAVWARAPLPVLILLASGPPIVAQLANGWHLFWRHRPELRPSFGSMDRSIAPRLARLGLLFLVLQVAVAFAYQSDVVVAAGVLGPEAAATYAVTARIFLLVPTVIAIAQTNLWPAYGEAIARGDIAWVTRTLRVSFLASAGLTAVAVAVLFILGPTILSVLSGDRLDAPQALLIGCALWAVVSASFNAIAMALNAASVVGFQAIIATIMAITSVVLSVLFARAYGVSGIVWGTLIAYVVCSAIPVLAYLPRFYARLERDAVPAHG